MFVPHGRLTRALTFTIVGEKIVEVDIITEAERLRQLDLAILDG